MSYNLTTWRDNLLSLPWHLQVDSEGCKMLTAIGECVFSKSVSQWRSTDMERAQLKFILTAANRDLLSGGCVSASVLSRTTWHPNERGFLERDLFVIEEFLLESGRKLQPEETWAVEDWNACLSDNKTPHLLVVYDRPGGEDCSSAVALAGMSVLSKVANISIVLSNAAGFHHNMQALFWSAEKFARDMFDGCDYQPSLDDINKTVTLWCRPRPCYVQPLMDMGWRYSVAPPAKEEALLFGNPVDKCLFKKITPDISRLWT